MPDLNFERQFDGPVIGIDEAGRGPWAGPVTVTAIWLCHSSYDNLPIGIDDSKKINPKQRIKIANQLICPPHLHYTVSIDVAQIDLMGVLQATFLAMVEAATGLCKNITAAGQPSPVHALVDGNLVPPKMPLPTTAIIKGDERSLSIAAASIIAKTTRDQFMVKLADVYPGYGWSSNMGYGTKSHQIGIKKLGITPHHRKSFKPIRYYLDNLKV